MEIKMRYGGGRMTSTALTAGKRNTCVRMCSLLYVGLFCRGTYAQSETVLNQIQWEHADSPLIIMLLIAGLLVAGFFIFVHIWRQRREREYSLELSQDYFDEYVQKYKLTDTEVDMLRQLLTYENVRQQQTIFQSIYLFERCVQAHIETLRKPGGFSEYAQQDRDSISSVRKKIGFGYVPLEHPLVSTRNIEVGVRGSLFHSESKAKLLDNVMVANNTELSLMFKYDDDEQEEVYLSAGDMLRFTFFRKNDGIYDIPVAVIAKGDDANIEVAHTLKFKRSQRRKYVRLEKMLSLRVRLIKTIDPDKSEVKVGTAFDCRGADIGGGGLSFLFEKSLRTGDIVSLSFKLGEKTYTGIRGKIVRISLQEGKTTTIIRHHVKFVKIEPRVQERIIKFIFQQQRQMIQWR